MFSTLRNRFGIPGVISVIALVFAMIGGAYAANNSGDGNATASAKKKKAKKKAQKGPRGPRGATGPAGPAGAQGPAGPAGAKGDNGAAGSNGTQGDKGATGATGTNGTSVTSTPEAPGPNCTTGGVKFTSASGNSYACNGAQGTPGTPGEPGEDGDPWTVGGTLPVGATETGTWNFNASTADENGVPVSISIPIRLAAALPASKVHYEGDDASDPGGLFTNTCTGSAANPTAPSGHLCVYVTTVLGAVHVDAEGGGGFFQMDGATSGASPSGSVMLFFPSGDGAFGFGSWAVTG